LTDFGVPGSVTGMTTSPAPAATAREQRQQLNTIARVVPIADVAVGDWVQDDKRAYPLTFLAEVTAVEKGINQYTGKPYIVLHIRRDWPTYSEPDVIGGARIWCEKEVTA
jgi:hypothetical protein